MSTPRRTSRALLPLIGCLALSAGILTPVAAIPTSVITPAASSATLAVVGTITLNDARQVGITSDDTVFVTSFTAGTVSVIPRGSTAITATIPASTNAQGIAVGSDDSVYVTNTGAGSVSVIDSVSQSVVRTITGLSEPLGIAMTSDDTAFVINATSNLVSRVPAGASTPDATISGGADPRSGIAVTSDDSVYVGDVQGDQIRIIDGRSMTLNSTIDGVDFPDAASTAGLPTDDTVYFGQTWQPNVIAVPPGTDDSVVLPALDIQNRGIQVKGSRLYSASDDSLVIYQREPWAALTSINPCGYVLDVAVNSSGVAYVTCPIAGQIVVAAEVVASLGVTTGDAGDTGSISLAIPDSLIADDTTIQSISFGGTPVAGWTRSGNTWSGPIPAGSGSVPVTITLQGGQTANVGTFAYSCPTPSTPSQVGGVYQLATAAELLWVRDDSTRWDDSYVLTADIDLGTCIWDSPIAKARPSAPRGTASFSGVFDGDGHEIINLTIAVNTKSIDDSTVDTAGFIGYLDDGGKVLDVTFRDATVTFDDTNNYDDSFANTKAAAAAVVVASVGEYGAIPPVLRNVTVKNSTVTLTMADTRITNTGWRYGIAGGVAGEVWTGDVGDLRTEGNVIQSFNYQSTLQRDNQAGGVLGVSDVAIAGLMSVDDSVAAVGSTVAAGGAIGQLWSETITDLDVTRPEILAVSTYESHAGGAIGTRWGRGASDVRVTGGSVTSQTLSTGNGSHQVGGAIGESDTGYSLDMRVTGTTVTANGRGFANAGGVIGLAFDDTLALLTSDSAVVARSSGANASYVGAGGLIGWYWGAATSHLRSSYATGDATAWSDDTSAQVYAGGLIGFIDRGNVFDSYALGDASATSIDPAGIAEAGGFVAGSEGPVTDSYSIGTATASGGLDDTVGGLVASNYIGGAVAGSFWNTTTSGLLTSDGGTGLTTDQMRSSSSFTGWTVIDGWQAQTLSGSPAQPDAPFWGQCSVNDGFPYLLWEYSVSPCATPPVPPSPVVKPSAPREVTAVAGDRSAVVLWKPPSSSGSFPITSYEVAFEGGGQACLVAATSDDTQTCVVEDLVNDDSYVFQVRALTGAGWGTWSQRSEPVTPRAAAIMITGSREGREVKVEGEAPQIVGAQVTPWYRFPGPHRYSAGVGVRTVAADGTFTWVRETGKRIYVYFRAQVDGVDTGIRSNRVIIQAR